MEDNKVEIAEKIQRLMDEEGITAYRLSKETGVSYTGLTKILNLQTTHPQIDSIKKIADYFSKPVTYFTDEQEVDTPEWATSKDKRDIKKILEEDIPVMFDGKPVDDEDRQRLTDLITGFLWDAKEKNKKTYGRKKKNDNNEA